jgi:hypothetical protein
MKCPVQQDVTQAAQWVVGDASIVRPVTPGVFAAVATGHTEIHASWQGLDSTFGLGTPVAVFPGTPPLQTYEIFGSVWQVGQTVATGSISGAVIEVLDGLVAGQTATSGVGRAFGQT